ncbi:hypothetical protein KKB58_01050 [Patescibacteria group bacterium]|nr:hypothetical protein [Patescibacteria group bacterium]
MEQPPKNKETLDKEIQETQEAIKKNRESQLAMLEALISIGAPEEKINALKKAMGVEITEASAKEETPVERIPEPEKPEDKKVFNTAPDEVDPDYVAPEEESGIIGSGRDQMSEEKKEKTKKELLKEAIEKGDEAEIKKIENETLEKIKEEEKKAEEPALLEKEEVLEKDPEDNLIGARLEYVREYGKFLKKKRKGLGVFRQLFGGKISEKEIPEELKELEQEYDKATVEYGKKMYAEKEAELIKSGMSEEKIEAELKKYKQNKIFTKVIIEEQSRLNALKAENLPPKEKGVFRKGLDWYLKQPRWKKIAISTALSTAIIASFSGGAIAAAGGIAAYAGTRYARGLAGSILGQSAAKAYDFFIKEKSSKTRAWQEQELKDWFAEESFDTSMATSKKDYAKILEREKKAKRQRLITKSLITIAAGGAASLSMGSLLSPEQVLSGDLDTHQMTGTEPEIAEIKAEVQDNFPQHGPGYEDDVTKGFPTEEQPAVNVEQNEIPATEPETNVEFKAEEVKFSSRGAIQTIEDLKKQIRIDYPDISKAPASIQEFMKTSSTEEAIKLGFYDPNAPAESAMAQSGTLTFDEQGNLKTHYVDMKGIEHDETLIQNENGNIKINKYGGEMFDSDKSGIQTTPSTETTGATPETGELDTSLVESQTEPVPVNSDISKISGGDAGIPQENPVPVGTETTGGAKIETLGNLSPEQLEQANEIHQSNIDYLFPDEEETHAWFAVKDSHLMPAEKLINMNTETMNETYKPMVLYMQNLREVTGLDPVPQTAIQVGETPEEYMIRCEKFAVLNGLEDKIRL